jgi:hypothetical protein
MKRWFGSILIAVVSSLVTLLLAWSTQGPRGDSARTALTADDAKPLGGPSASDDVLKQIASLDLPEQGDTFGRGHSGQHSGDRTRDQNGAGNTGTAVVSNANSSAPPPSGFRLRQDFIDRCVEVAHDIDSDLGKRVAALRQKDPAEFEHSMRQLGRRLFALAELKQRDPDLYTAKISELRLELAVRLRARELCQVRASGNTAEAQSQEAALRSTLAQQLLMSIKSRGEMACRLQEQVDAIKAELTYQASHYNEILENRFQTLISQCQSDGDIGPPASAEPVSANVPAAGGK